MLYQELLQCKFLKGENPSTYVMPILQIVTIDVMPILQIVTIDVMPILQIVTMSDDCTMCTWHLDTEPLSAQEGAADLQVVGTAEWSKKDIGRTFIK